MSHFITLAKARQMTATYRSQKNNILDPAFRDRKILPDCESFDRAAIEAILAQNECTEFRIYYGMDNELKIHAILVGVDATGEHILPADQDADAANTQIAEMARRCPDDCPNNML